MRKSTQRQIAISAARSYLREQGIDPLVCDVHDMFAALDDLLRLDNTLIASIWYIQMSANQERLFRREFNQWRENWIVANRLARRAVRRLNCAGPDFDGALNALDALTAKMEE